MPKNFNDNREKGNSILIESSEAEYLVDRSTGRLSEEQERLRTAAGHCGAVRDILSSLFPVFRGEWTTVSVPRKGTTREKLVAAPRVRLSFNSINLIAARSDRFESRWIA